MFFKQLPRKEYYFFKALLQNIKLAYQYFCLYYILNIIMFPTSIGNPYQQRNRRRARNDANNRDYICPCGKSYLSYPALFTHIKTKHNGRAPGQIIKPRSENISRRGRPRAKEDYDQDSETQDIASNALDKLCDFITEVEKNQQANLKQIYQKEPFYDTYLNFNQQQQQPRYNEIDDMFEENCDNVFSQFIAQVNKRLNQPYYVDLMFLFMVMLSRAINEDKGNPKQTKQEPIRNIAQFVNKFFLEYYPVYKRSLKLQNIQLFSKLNMAKLLEHFYNWLLSKKYLCYKIRMDIEYFK